MHFSHYFLVCFMPPLNWKFKSCKSRSLEFSHSSLVLSSAHSPIVLSLWISCCIVCIPMFSSSLNISSAISKLFLISSRLCFILHIIIFINSFIGDVFNSLLSLPNMYKIVSCLLNIWIEVKTIDLMSLCTEFWILWLLILSWFLYLIFWNCLFENYFRFIKSEKYREVPWILYPVFPNLT